MTTGRISALRELHAAHAGSLGQYNARLAEEWRSRGIDPEIFWRLLHNPRLCEVLGIGFSHGQEMQRLEGVQRALTSALLAPRAQVVQEESYHLEVSSTSFGEALRKANFDHVEEPDVTAENFGAPGEYTGDVSLLQMNRYLWPDEIEDVLGRRDQRWAGSSILLALAAKFPDVQRSRLILSGASAMVEAPSLQLCEFLRDRFSVEMGGAGVSQKHLVHLHLTGGSALRSIGTARVDKLNDQITAGSTWILAVRE